MSFPRYLKYKDSSVEWLGKVPEHWSVAPFKWQIERNDGGVWGDDPDGSNDTIVLRSTEQTVDGRWKIDDPAPRKLSESEISDCLLVEGDLLLTKSSGSSLHIGKTTLVTPEIAAMRCCYSNFMQRIRTKESFLPKLAWHILNNGLARLQFDLLSNSTTGLANLNGTMIGEIVLPAPPIEEQTAIAAFLDHETAKIDDLVEEQKRLIEQLKEKRQAVISHAITKGLNPRAQLKSSGIVWLGDVPEHWDVRKLGSCTAITRLAGAEYTAFWRPDDNGPIIALRGQNIRANALDLTNCERISEELSQKLSRSRLSKGDVVYPCVGSIGNAALIDESDRYHINQNIAKLTANQAKLYPLFLTQFLNSKVALESALFLNTSDAQPSILVSNLRKVMVPLPLLEEQKEIAAYLVKRTNEFESLESEAQYAINLLQERRTALVFAAVTGQIDVRGLVESEAA